MSHPYPLRYSIPAVLLLLGLLLTGVATFDDLHSTGPRVEALTRERAEAIGTRTSAKLAYEYAHDDLPAAEIEVSTLVSVPYLRTGVAVDETNRVLAATEGSLRGQLLSGTPAALLEKVRQSHGAQFQWSPDGSTLGGAFPFLLPSISAESHPSRAGGLYLEFDLSAQKRIYRTDTIRRVALMASVALVLCLLAWLYIERTLTRRAARLVAATREFAAGNFPEQSASVRGSDELAQLSDSFRRMAADMQAHTAALRQSEEHLKLVLRGSELGTWMSNLETGELVCDERACAMLGYALGEIKSTQRGWRQLIHPDELAVVEAALQAHLEGKTTVYEAEYRLRHKSGSWVWVLDTGRVVQHDAAGHPLGVAGTRRDVTKRREAEVALSLEAEEHRRDEEALRRRDAILEAVSTSSTEWISRGDWQAVVPEALARLGRAADVSRVYVSEIHVSAEGTPMASRRFEWVADGIPTEINNPKFQDFPMVAAGFGRWMAALEGVNLIAGHVRDFPESERTALSAQGILSLVVTPIVAGERLWGLLGFEERRAERDWPEPEIGALQAAANALGASIGRDQAEAEMREAEAEAERHLALLETSYDSLAEGVVICDLDGNIFFWNRAALAMHGYSSMDECRRNLHEFQETFEILESDGALIPLEQWPLPRILRGEAVRDWEAQIRRKGDGWGKWFSYSGALAKDKDGRPLLAVVSCADVTERRRSEQRIQHLHRVQAVLSGINKTIVHEREPKAMLAAACRIAVEQGGFRMAAIGLVEAPPGGSRFAAHAGSAPDTLEILERIFADPQKGCAFTAQALTTGKHAACNDVATDPQAAPWRDAALERGYRALVSLPLKVGAEMFGTFNLYSSETSFFDAAELDLLDEVAMDVSFAIEFNRQAAERQLAEQALRLFRTQVDHVDDAIEVIDPETGRFLDINEKGCLDLGYTREEILRLTVPDVNPTLELSGFVERLKALKHTNSASRESLHRRKDGSTFPVEVNSKWISLDRDYVVSVVRDITARRQAEATLAHERTLLRTLIDNLPGYIYIKDADGRYLIANRPHLELFGAASEADILGKTVFDLFPREIAAQFAEDDRIVVAAGEPVVGREEPYEIGDKRGWFSTTKVPLRDADGKVAGLVGITLDTTERKRTEEAIHASQQMLRLILDNIPQGVFWKDRESRYLGCNAVVARNRGVENAESLIGLCDRDFGSLTPEQAEIFIRKDREVIASGKPQMGLIEQSTLADGSTHWLETNKVPLPDKAGNVIGVLGTWQDITERKQAQEALDRERTLLRTLIDLLPDHIYVKDAQSRFLLANDASAQAIGAGKPENLIGKSDREFYSPEESATFRADEEEVLAGRPMFNKEEPATHPDGLQRFILTTKVPLRDATGKVIGLVGIGRDITARMQAEEALKMMSFSVDRAGDSIFWLSREGRILYANDAACSTRGYSREELLGMTIFDLDPDFQPGVWAPHFEDLKRRGSITFETRHRTKDGRVYPVEVNANYVHIGAQEFNFCSLRDITSRRAAEEEISRLAAFPELNPNPVIELTAEGSVHYHNAAARSLARELGFAHVREMLPQGTPEIVRECVATWKTHSRPDVPYGKQIVSWSFYPIPNRCVVHCYAADVTEQRQLTEQLRQVQKMESVGQLAAGIAHDFNNLLTVVQGYSELLHTELADRPQAIESVEQIIAAGDRAANLTRQLLLFSRKQVAQRNLLDINELTGNLTKMLGRVLGEDITLRLECRSGLPPVFADPGMIEQVITNLSVNARDAMPAGGRLEIATSVVELSADQVLRNPEAKAGSFVCVSVSDTGSGISPQVLPRIFEPFFTTKGVGKGTGLGLATVYGIVMQHQGVLDVTSQPGQGTCFRVFLPSATGAEQVVTETTKPERPQGGRETILLVEDQEVVLHLVETILKRAGYTVLTAMSGMAAERIWQDHAAKIDLLLTDMVMPEGVTGKQLAANLKAQKPVLRVIFMSGYNPELRGGASGIEEGFNYLKKPFTNPALLKAVRRQLDSRG